MYDHIDSCRSLTNTYNNLGVYHKQLKKEEVWKPVMTKIAFRDCRKEALDI